MTHFHGLWLATLPPVTRVLGLGQLVKRFADRPDYQLALANASAIKATDKMIFVPDGVFPQLIFGNDLKPVVPVNATPTQQ